MPSDEEIFERLKDSKFRKIVEACINGSKKVAVIAKEVNLSEGECIEKLSLIEDIVEIIFTPEGYTTTSAAKRVLEK